MADDSQAEELQALEAWFAERGLKLEYDLGTGSSADDPDWMAVVIRADDKGRTPAYITGYGTTKLDAARSAQRRVLRHRP